MLRRQFLKLLSALPLAALFSLQIPEGYCGRCDVPIYDLDEAETCWWCIGPLCYDCWDRYGHCGHLEAEAMNEYARAISQPILTDDEKKIVLQRYIIYAINQEGQLFVSEDGGYSWYDYLAHLFRVTDSAMLKLMER